MERPGAVNANAGAKEPAQGAAFFPTLFHLRRFRTDRAARTSFSSFWTHFQKEIAFLGTESSPAFVRAPEGNGCAERFIRTLKENLLWVRTFETIEELRQALLEFRDAYNAAWLIERHGFISPIEFREKRLRVRASRMFRYQVQGPVGGPGLRPRFPQPRQGVRLSCRGGAAAVVAAGIVAQSAQIAFTSACRPSRTAAAARCSVAGNSAGCSTRSPCPPCAATTCSNAGPCESTARRRPLILKHEDADTDTDTRRSSAFEGSASQPQFFHRICRASSGTAALGLLGMTRTE